MFISCLLFVTVGLQGPKAVISLRYKLIGPKNVGEYSCLCLVGLLCVLMMMHGHASMLVSVMRKPNPFTFSVFICISKY